VHYPCIGIGGCNFGRMIMGKIKYINGYGAEYPY